MLTPAYPYSDWTGSGRLAGAALLSGAPGFVGKNLAAMLVINPFNGDGRPVLVPLQHVIIEESKIPLKPGKQRKITAGFTPLAFIPFSTGNGTDLVLHRRKTGLSGISNSMICWQQKTPCFFLAAGSQSLSKFAKYTWKQMGFSDLNIALLDRDTALAWDEIDDRLIMMHNNTYFTGHGDKLPGQDTLPDGNWSLKNSTLTPLTGACRFLPRKESACSSRTFPLSFRREYVYGSCAELSNIQGINNIHITDQGL